MHRRQYLPGSSGVKLNRARLASENHSLKDNLLRERGERARVEEARHAAEVQRQNSGIRGLFKKVRRVLTTPIRTGVR